MAYIWQLVRDQDLSLTNFSGASPLPSMDSEFRLAADLCFENTKQASLD